MGIVMGALGGAGAAMQDMGATMMKSDLALDNERTMAGVRNDLETQRMKTLAEFKNTLDVNTANQQREAQVSRVNAAAGGIVSGAINSKYAPSDSAVAAADAGQTDAPLTPEQRAAIQQSKDLDRTNGMMDPKVRMQAAIQTGDISPEKAATLGQSAEISQMKLDSLMQRADDKNATMKEIADVRAEAMKYGYDLRLQAAQEKQRNGKVDTATSRMLITSEDANIRASTSQLGMIQRELADPSMRPTLRDGKTPNPEYLNLKTQMDDLRADIAASKKTKIQLFKSLGIVPEDDEDAPVPAATPSPRAASSATKPPLSSFMK